MLRKLSPSLFGLACAAGLVAWTFGGERETTEHTEHTERRQEAAASSLFSVCSVCSVVSPRFTAPKSFRVEMAAKNPDPKDVFSLVNMTFDAKGRLLVSQEGGPVLLCTDPDKDGVLQNVRPYCSIVKNCQGMCWVGDALLLVGDGPRGAGLYRCRDAKGKDEIDEATLLLSYGKAKAPGRGEVGGMGEHGPHAVLHGPDDALYVVNGNHTWANVGNLAANSPLRRWPHGQMGPDQDQPGSTEDALLPRLNNPYGHGANILAPGGCVWRLDPDGRNPALAACGLRNVFDAAFSLNGELFTFDSDMEGDEGLPWYRPVRVCHCPPGADFSWRTGSANTPPYYIDSLPAIYDVGRGSPVGLEFYEHTAFPPRYQGAYLMADWSLGIIYAARLKPDGATYKLDLEKFCTGAPMNVTDIGVAPDGSVYFTMGGRHTQGGVYRIVYDGGDKKEGDKTTPERLLSWPQPQAAWSRAALDQWIADQKIDLSKELFPVIGNAGRPAAERIKAMMLLQMHGRPLDVNSLVQLILDRDAQVLRPGRLPDRRQQRPRGPAGPGRGPQGRRPLRAAARLRGVRPLQPAGAVAGPLAAARRLGSVRPHRRPAVFAAVAGQGLGQAPVDGGERPDFPGGRRRPVRDRSSRPLRGADFRPPPQRRARGRRGAAAIPARGAAGASCTRRRTSGPAASAASPWSARSCFRRRTGASTASWPWC